MYRFESQEELKTRNRNNQNKKSGFTLIELLIVVSIIGLLASIILVAVSKSRQAAQVASIEQDVEAISKGLELYHAEYGQYPSGYFNSTVNSGSMAWSNFQQALAPYVQVPSFQNNQVVLATYSTLSPWLVNYPNDPNTYCETPIPSGSGSDHGYVLWVMFQQSDNLTLNDGGVFKTAYEFLGSPYKVGLWSNNSCQ